MLILIIYVINEYLLSIFCVFGFVMRIIVVNNVDVYCFRGVYSLMDVIFFNRLGKYVGLSRRD